MLFWSQFGDFQESTKRIPVSINYHWELMHLQATLGPVKNGVLLTTKETTFLYPKIFSPTLLWSQLGNKKAFGKCQCKVTLYSSIIH